MDTRPPHLLFAVDGSPPADWALQVGTTLARRLNGVISIVHIIPPPNKAIQSNPPPATTTA